MLALLYDIHGNLPALEAVLGDARERVADAAGRPVERVGIVSGRIERALLQP